MTRHVKIQGVIPRIQYVADGTVTAFEFPFSIFQTSDIDVYFGDSLQDVSTYTVSKNTYSDGGVATFHTPPADGIVITIVRNLAIERTSDFQDGGTLRAKTLNDEFDYQIACQQQLADNLNRSMVLPPYALDANIDLVLPMPSAGKAIVWNSDGTNLENSTVEVNALESTLKDYKTVAQNAAVTATEKADIASDKAETATIQAQIATDKADEATTTLANKAEKDFSNVSEENAHKLVGNRIWFSGEYVLSSSANVVISHNLGLTDVKKVLAIPYLKFTNAYAGYEAGEIISNFSICGSWYTPGDVLCSIITYGPFLNLTENTAVLPKIINNSGVVFFNKNSGVPVACAISNFKIFVKIIY